MPFEQALPWSGRWDDLPAAHGAAITFDLLALGGLLLLGRRMRPGREGAVLGVALGYAWVAYPYTTFVLESNSNDTLVAVACVGALLAATLARDRASAAVAGVALALGAAAKFVTAALAPLFARRSPVVLFGMLLLVLALAVAPFIPDGGVRELYDRTIGYQASRPSPFSIWGQVDSLGWLQNIVKGAATGLAVLAAFRPSAPDLRQIAAMGAAILIAVELTATHWFYLYIVWFVPFILVASDGGARGGARRGPGGAGGGTRGGVRVTAAFPRVPRDVRGAALVALLLLVAGWALTLWIAPWSDQRVNDLFVYRTFAAPVVDGSLPYRDVAFEYPPLAAPAIALPGLAGTGEERLPLGVRRVDAPGSGRRGPALRRARPRHRR